MSFSSDIKAELCKCSNRDCCARAECYGMIFFSRSFARDDISVLTESHDVAKAFSSLIKRLYGCRVAISEHGSTRKRYKAYLPAEAERRKVLLSLFGGDGAGRDRINSDFINKSCCMSAFLRGAFLSCGTVSDPEKQYRLEFVMKSNAPAVELYGLLYRRGVNPYMSARDRSVIVYIKKSEDIEDLLTAMDAPRYSLELMSVKVVKEIRNTENRKNNFETANIAKTASASVLQCRAVEKLKRSGRLAELSDELADTARLRIENPDASLSQLLELYNAEGGELTRSGLNHRLAKLIKLSEELTDE